MESIGINPQEIETTQSQRSGYAYKNFEIDGKFYIIEEPTDDRERQRIMSLITLYKDDAFKSSGNNTFTYLIGTQYNINTVNKTIMRSHDAIRCDIDKLHIWSKPSVSIQEIESKHGTILQELIDNYNDISQAFATGRRPDDTKLYDNAIDQLYYAGEMKYNYDTNELSINFLSGTYMNGIIDCRNPPEQTISCIKRFLEEKIGIDNVVIDKSCESYINQKMTMELLNLYANNGIPVYVFDNKTNSDNYLQKPRNINILISQISQQERVAIKYPSADLTEKINKLKIELERVQGITAERYVPPHYAGAIIRRTRRRTKPKKENKKTRRKTKKLKK